MTTIVYHHKTKTVAVDSRVTAGNNIISDTENKIHKASGKTFALCGTNADIGVYLNDIENPPKDLDVAGVIIDGGKAYGMCFDCDFVKWELTHDQGFGSGHQYAIAALDFGKSAKEAVKYAATKDCKTGGRIRVVKVQG